MRLRLIFVSLAVLAACLLAGLGIWQVQRLFWKLDLIATVDARLAAPAVPLPARFSWPQLAKDGAYSKVRVAGTWKPAPPVFTKAVTDLGSGSWVLSPLQTNQGIVLVNRGFVPDQARTTIKPVSGETVVEGLVRLSEPGGGFLRSNDATANRWFSRDVAAIAKARGWNDPAPFFIDAPAQPGVTWPRGGMTVVRFRNTHLVYALTWFALAALAGWFAWRVARVRPEAQTAS